MKNQLGSRNRLVKELVAMANDIASVKKSFRNPLLDLQDELRQLTALGDEVYETLKRGGVAEEAVKWYADMSRVMAEARALLKRVR